MSIERQMEREQERAKPCVRGMFQGECRQNDNGLWSRARISMKIRCGKWECPICGKRKAKRVLARALKGKIYDDATKPGFRNRYAFKLLTLTYGGEEKRRGSNPDRAAKEMTDAFTAMRKVLNYDFGHFEYIKVFEPHKDGGWPHLHALFSGEEIASKGVLKEIERLWREKYGMGFVKLNVVDSPKRGISYVLKYLFKCPRTFSRVRLFSNSENALERCRKKKEKIWEWSNIHWGNWKEKIYDSLFELQGEDYKCDVLEVFPVLDCPF